VCVSEWISDRRVSLGADLNLLLKAKVSGETKLGSKILEESGYWINGLRR
jgi:hypothetical protein